MRCVAVCSWGNWRTLTQQPGLLRADDAACDDHRLSSFFHLSSKRAYLVLFYVLYGKYNNPCWRFVRYIYQVYSTTPIPNCFSLAPPPSRRTAERKTCATSILYPPWYLKKKKKKDNFRGETDFFLETSGTCHEVG